MVLSTDCIIICRHAIHEVSIIVWEGSYELGRGHENAVAVPGEGIFLYAPQTPNITQAHLRADNPPRYATAGTQQQPFPLIPAYPRRP